MVTLASTRGSRHQLVVACREHNRQSLVLISNSPGRRLRLLPVWNKPCASVWKPTNQFLEHTCNMKASTLSE